MIEKLRQDHDIVAQVEDLTLKVNEIISYLDAEKAERCPYSWVETPNGKKRWCEVDYLNKGKFSIEKCPACKGKGGEMVDEENPIYGGTWVKCEQCNGTGKPSTDNNCRCHRKPGELIPVEDVKKPICPKCGKRIEPLGNIWLCGNKPQGSTSGIGEDKLEEIITEFKERYYHETNKLSDNDLWKYCRGTGISDLFRQLAHAIWEKLR